MLLFALRAILSIPLVLGYFVPALLERLGIRKTTNLAWPARYCRRATRIFGWRARWQGCLDQLPKPGLVVMNHMSWVDPLQMAAFRPLRFVTSVEIERTPFLGDVSRRSGCVFVERRQVRSVAKDCQAIAAHLKKGAVVVFPEATSTDGRTVRDFKPAFFQSAIEAGMPVRPVALRYLAVDGRPFCDATRNRICWYGDMTFLPHFLGILSTRHIDAVFTVGQDLPTHPGMDRRELAALAHRKVMEMWAAAAAARS